MELSQRAKNLKTSPTLALVAKAKELAAQGNDVLSLTVGEPDWSTFPAAAQAGIEAIQQGITKYTPAQGTIELRKAIARVLEHDIGVSYNPQQVCVSSGAKFAIFAGLQVLCSPGDEVIIPSPYWVSYPTMAELADAKPVIVDCKDVTHFKLTADQLEKAITPKTRVLLLCSPSNPTGQVYHHKELGALAEVLRKHPRVIVISDDMYNRLMFDGSRVAPHLLQVAPDLKDRVLIINGASKTFAMTGWRLGWAAGHPTLIKAMADYQSQAMGSPSSISQHAGLKVIESSEGQIADVVRKLMERRKLFLQALATVPGFKVATPGGAFYLWVDIQAHLGKTYQGRTISSSRDFCDILLDQYYVATVPGIESGVDGYMRLSFAVTEETMTKAIERMKQFIADIYSQQ